MIFDDLKKVPFHVVAKSRVPSLRRNGGEFIGNCPFHKDKTPSFTIYKNDDKIYLYKCHGCGANGNVIQFVQRLDKVSTEQAIEIVKKELDWFEGKQVVDSTFSNAFESKKELVTFPVSKLYDIRDDLLVSESGQKWLENRGIYRDTAFQMGWGFVQDISEISKHPWAKDGWIAMPTIEDDKIVSIKYRSVKGKKTPDGKVAIRRFPGMKTCLYNLQLMNPLEDAFLVEGEPDCAVMTQAFYATCALPMADYVITPAERDILMQANRLFLAGDCDGAVGTAAMKKLWGELRGKTYLIEWPEGCKDANDALVKCCDKSNEKFIKLVEGLKAKALEKPIPDFYDLSQTLRNADFSNPMENSRRLHMRDSNVDKMAITLPGNVVSAFATYTGSGKTTWILDQFELDAVLKYNQIVLNYSAELSPDEFSRLVTANVLQKNRLELTKEDFESAAKEFDNSRGKLYIGYNPDLSDPDAVLDVIEAAVKRLGAHIVVLDHLHFYTVGDNDVKQQARAMQRIKNIARKFELIFVVVGQSRKEQPNRKNRASEASDAKGTEMFISVATTTYHIHRGLKKDIDWDNPPSDLLDDITDVRLYKCRCKGPGKAVARQIFRGEIGRFYPYSGAQP